MSAIASAGYCDTMMVMVLFELLCICLHGHYAACNVLTAALTAGCWCPCAMRPGRCTNQV
jgi:hypothetical protein